jgi:phosphatidylserine/phosphatidylglycerophosphate/cardiolipin synthase-like enzyme
VVGHPARDLARHFIARWNYVRSTAYYYPDETAEAPPPLLPFSEAALATIAGHYLRTHNIGVRRMFRWRVFCWPRSPLEYALECSTWPLFATLLRIIDLSPCSHPARRVA